jgi:hypothetical protein
MNKFLRFVIAGFILLFLSTSFFLAIGIADAEEQCDVGEYLIQMRDFRREYEETSSQGVNELENLAWRYMALMDYRINLIGFDVRTIPPCAYEFHGTMIAWVLAQQDSLFYLVMSGVHPQFAETYTIFNNAASEIEIRAGEMLKGFGNDGA